MAESERMAQEQDADIMQAACDGQCAVVGSIERKRKEQSAPKLYDLTTSCSEKLTAIMVLPPVRL